MLIWTSSFEFFENYDKPRCDKSRMGYWWIFKVLNKFDSYGPRRESKIDRIDSNGAGLSELGYAHTDRNTVSQNVCVRFYLGNSPPERKHREIIPPSPKAPLSGSGRDGKADFQRLRSHARWS